MQRLPYFWFGLAALVFIGAGYRMLIFSAGTVGVAGAISIVGIQAITTTLAMLCTGLIYMFMLKVPTHTGVGTLGFIHLALSTLASALYFAGGLAQARLLEGMNEANQMAIYFGAGTAASILGYLIFLTALIVAIASYPANNLPDTYS